LFGSVRVLTHAAPHHVGVPDGHVHTLATQFRPPVHWPGLVHSTHVAVGGVAKQYGVGVAHAIVFQWRQLVPK